MTDTPNNLSLLDAALCYAARGWPVFPLLPRSKRPFTRHGVKDATTDPAQIHRWWAAQPDANIGLDCGGAGLVVIDVDVVPKDEGGRMKDEIETVEPSSFILHPSSLTSVTGSLKSTLAALALSHFGDWTADDLIGWNTTANALGKLLFHAKDVPLVIDDFAPQADRHAADRLEATAAAVVRDSGNRAGRGRMRSDLSLAMTYRPRGLMIATGEQLPETSSILSRLVTVEMRLGEVNLDLLTREQNGRARYAEAMSGFIVWMLAQDETLQRTARLEAKAYSDQLRALGQHLRLPDALGLLHSGFVRALRYAEEIGALTADEAARWRSEGWRVMVALGERHADIVAEERPVARFLTILGELLAQGKLRLEPLHGDGDSGVVPRTLGSADGTLIGWYDAQYLYLLPSVSYNTISRFAKDEGRHFGTKERALWKALAEEGILETEEGRTTMRLSIHNQQHRLLWLRRSAIEKASVSL